MNEWEERNRDLKVQALTAHLRAVHQALPPRLPLDVWVRLPHFPMLAMARACGVRPPSSKTVAMVLSALGEGEG